MSLSSEPSAAMRRTRIVATLGPASCQAQTIKDLMSAGADILRLNLSHGDLASHRAAFRRVREASLELGHSAAVLADLCGPKIRVGTLPAGEVLLCPGDQVTLTGGEVTSRPGCIPVTYAGLCRDVAEGATVLLDDGLLELHVDRVEPIGLACTVVRGGRLKSGKSVNAPGADLALSSLTTKDRADAAFAVRLGVEFLALSFVRSASDVEDLRDLVASLRPASPPMIVAKIETRQALDDIDGILAAADAIMVARGDLGVEIGCEYVPAVQRALIARARTSSKPVIVATQMLESMVHAGVPTRAEVADVAYAVACGADATMLSAETASGAHPVEAVAAMARIAGVAEAVDRGEQRYRERDRDGETAGRRAGLQTQSDHFVPAFARLTGELAGASGGAAIVVFGEDDIVGAVSAAGRQWPVLVPVDSGRRARRLALRSGVIPVPGPVEPTTDPVALAALAATHLGDAASDLPIVAVVQHPGPGPGGLSLHLVRPVASRRHSSPAAARRLAAVPAQASPAAFSDQEKERQSLNDEHGSLRGQQESAPAGLRRDRQWTQPRPARRAVPGGRNRSRSVAGRT